MGEALLEHVDELARHPFGNYVVQHMLQYGEPEQQKCIMSAIQHSSAALSCDPFGSAVVRAALASDLNAERAALAKRIAKDRNLLLSMACARPSHVTACRVIEALEIPERRALAQELATSQALAKSQYARAVFQSLGLSPPRRSSKLRELSRAEASAVLGGA